MKEIKIKEINLSNNSPMTIIAGLNVLEDEDMALDVAEKLKEIGILVGAIRPPTVPKGTARLRISLSLGHSETDIQFALEHIIKIVKS